MEDALGKCYEVEGCVCMCVRACMMCFTGTQTHGLVHARQIVLSLSSISSSEDKIQSRSYLLLDHAYDLAGTRTFLQI